MRHAEALEVGREHEEIRTCITCIERVICQLAQQADAIFEPGPLDLRPKRLYRGYVSVQAADAIKTPRPIQQRR